jgi:ADP-heptose:LPS heptosyltransferase
MKKLFSMLFHSLSIPWQIRLKKEVALLYNEAGYGDTLMVGAVAREIKRRYGKVRITVNRVKEELLRNNPNIDNIGQRYNGIDVNYHYGRFNVGKHFERNIIDVMCQKVGIRNPSHSVNIFLTDEEVDYAHSVMDNLEKPAITIQTTADSFDNGRKLWPEGYWVELVELLINKKCSVIQIGGSEERPIKGAYNFLGKQDIRRSIAMIQAADIHIGIVSSLMHGTAAVNTSAVILYGGFERYTNHDYKNIIPIESDISCAPCIEAYTVMEKCPNNNQCMKDITPSVVFNKVVEILNI